MGRYQRGYIYEAFSAFHVRYRAQEIVDGKPTKVQRSHRICPKEEGFTKRSTSVQRKCAQVMATVNPQVPTSPQASSPTRPTSIWLTRTHGVFAMCSANNCLMG